MKVRTQRRVFVGGMSLSLVSNLGYLVTSPHASVWSITVSAVAGTCQLGAIGISLRDYRHRERWEEVGE
ncbi:hypothetical protein [Streptomyces sp. NPDC102360]|uniref:hypothetical protein n=1 Tax=Streptomyces sp. NPDC102360 TaxID=3366160 RepID=UPI00381115E3